MKWLNFLIATVSLLLLVYGGVLGYAFLSFSAPEPAVNTVTIQQSVEPVAVTVISDLAKPYEDNTDEAAVNEPLAAVRFVGEPHTKASEPKKGNNETSPRLSRADDDVMSDTFATVNYSAVASQLTSNNVVPTSTGSTGAAAITDLLSDSLSPTAVDSNGNPIPPISGRVTDEAGEPVANYKVSATAATSAGSAAKVTVTNGEGLFKFTSLDKGEYVLKTQDHPFFGTLMRRVRTGSSATNFKLSRLDVAQIMGSVTDEYGQPINNVKIVPPMADEEFFSNEEGLFTSPITATAGQGLLLRFSAKGFLPETKYLSGTQWQPSGPVDINVKMRRGSFSLSGKVYDEQGSSVESALVQITSKQARLHRSAQTDKDGNFTLDQVITADDYSLKISAGIRFDAYERADMTLADGMGSMQVPLAYSPIGGIRGRIVDESGSPVTALSLMVMSDGAGGRAATITSDENGGYSLQNFVAGEVSLRSRTAPGILVKKLEIEPGIVNELDLVVDMGNHSTHGKITDESGLPVSGAKIMMRYYRKDPIGFTTEVKRETSSDPEGIFRFDSLGAGNRTLKVSANGYRATTLIHNPESDPGPHALVLAR